MGAGPIGLCVTQALRAHNVSQIIVVETNPTRQSAATQAGATYFLNPLTQDVGVEVARLCADTNGVHVAYDTAGKQVTLDQCVSAVGVGGTVVNIAVWGGPATILPNAFLFGEKRFMGSAIYTPEDFDEVIEAVGSGKSCLVVLLEW
jgi:threonine dehydrogenase-like Zn-dependent dehydrogenase